MNNSKKAIVVGAGISGLTAAYRLKQAGFAVKVLETKGNVGGRANTVKKDGYTIDTGASAILASYQAYWALAKELGLLGEIVPGSQYVGIIRDGMIHYLNTGAAYRSDITTGLLSWPSKLRLALAFLDVRKAKSQGLITFNNMGAAEPLDTETVRQYCERRLNTEIADYFAEPILRGMMLANSDVISKVELLHGLNNIMDAKVFGLKGGVKVFSDTLAKHVEVKLNSPVTSVRAVGGGAEVSWQEKGQTVTESADACVIACPFPFAAKIYGEHQALQTLNSKMRYGKCISVAIGTRQRPHNKAYILQVPRVENEEVCYMFLEHNKFTGATPEGCGLISALLEDRISEQLMDASDEEIVARTLPFLEKVMPEIAGTVEMTHVVRWSACLPLNEVGAFKAVNDFKAALTPDDPIQFAGDYVFSAVGQSIAVESGNRVAKNLIRKFDASKYRQS